MQEEQKGETKCVPEKNSIHLLRVNCMKRMGRKHYGLVPSVRQSVRICQVENYWKDKNNIWYGCYAIRDYLPIILLNFQRLFVSTRRMRKFMMYDRQQASEVVHYGAKVRTISQVKTAAGSITSTENAFLPGIHNVFTCVPCNAQTEVSHIPFP
jgi:hypothetical protein